MLHYMMHVNGSSTGRRENNVKKILLHAYGNPGRGDDGLGNAFIGRMKEWIKEFNLHSVATDDSYQLNIEDASFIAGYDIVIFVDASKAKMESFTFSRVHAETHPTFTTHSVSPSSLVALCLELYDRSPLVYLLQIKGYQWDFGEGLSKNAEKNLQEALIFAQKTILDFQKQE